MRILNAICTAILVLTPMVAPSAASAQSLESLAVPAIAFQGHRAIHNTTGTATFIRERAFAPVYLPDGARVTSFTCGARMRVITKAMRISLRRNHPQQANVDMGSVEISKGSPTGFTFLTADPVIEPVVDNRRFNYYMVAEVLPKSANVSDLCVPQQGGTECLVGACNITYFAPIN